MEGQNGDALSVRGRSQNRKKNKVSSGRSKSIGRSKSPGKPLKVCWKCGKEWHFKKVLKFATRNNEIGDYKGQKKMHPHW